MVPPLRIDAVVMARLVDSVDRAQTRLEDPGVRATVAAVTHASTAFTRLLMSDESGMDVLEGLDTRLDPPAGADELARWSRLEMLRIAARDLTGIDTVDGVGRQLAALADDVLRVALASQGEAAADLGIVTMGKLAGRELNYASDIDVMLVGKATVPVARRVLDVARRCFRVDTALRPEGSSGSLVRSLASYEEYWERWASPWEFQALLKSRIVAGPQELMDAWNTSSEHALWARPFGAEEIRSVRDMKLRAEELIERKGLAAHEVKRGRGGIRDVEFAVQLLQLVHGRRDPFVRSKSTLGALRQLAQGGYIDDADRVSLSASYEFLRTVEHRLQMVELEQTHTVPRDNSARARVAATVGLELDAFDKELRQHQTAVRHAHERLYFRPLLENFGDDKVLDSESVQERLTAFGFTDASRTRSAITELTKGLARSSRLMQQMMPLLLDWLSSSPDPDEGLLGLRTLMSGFRTPSQIVAAFRDSPEVARRICFLLGTSRAFARALVREPVLLEAVAKDGVGEVDNWQQRAETALEWRHERADRLYALARFNHVYRTHISMFDTLNILDDYEASVQRSELADAVLNTSLANLEFEVPIALVGMGRYGGSELGPGSDLDVVVIHGGLGAEAQQEAETAARRLLKNVSHPSPAYRLYELDYGLRPEGKQGALARSVEGCAEYYGKWASTWERQALVRARFVGGEPAVADAFFSVVDDFVWGSPPDATQVREIRHLKARMESERVSRHEDSRFHLKLGKGTLSDVEWTVQLLQLLNGVRETSTTGAIEGLRNKGCLSEDDAKVLDDAWRFCQRVRNRLALIGSTSGDSFPTDPSRLGVLARSLGTTPSDLREEYLRLTRRSRAATERLFYGASEQ